MCCDFTDGVCGHMHQSREHEFEPKSYIDTNGTKVTVLQCKKCNRLYHNIGVDEYCERSALAADQPAPSKG